MDNNAFAGNFDAKAWLSALLKYLPYKDTCLGIPVPDVVGDSLGTLRLFSNYWRIVKDLGYPVSFVTQDGITPEITPWDFLDVLFVGGTDEHKLSSEAGIMIAEGLGRDKRVHVGRVNSPARIKKFWMCDSVDGTHLTREFKKQQQEVVTLASAVQFCREKKNGSIRPTGQYQFIGV